MPSSKILAVLGAGALLALIACSDDESSPPSGGSGGTPGDPSPGCGSPDAPKGLLARQKLGERTYELFVPESHDGKKTFPLVFVFHGSGGTGAQIRKSYDLEGAAAGGAIFVYPDGRGNEWDLEGRLGANRDIELFDDLVETISKTYCVDKKRVFATGYSNGAYFANQLGCRRGGPLRAIAAHAGGGPFGGDNDYDDKGNLVCPSAPVAALVAHGTADGAVSLDEGHSSRDHWQRVNGCNTGTSAYEPAPCVAFAGCAPERPVVYCEVPGLGHQVWPESGASATWAFFASLP